MSSSQTPKTSTQPRGFARMDPEQRRAMGKKGGSTSTPGVPKGFAKLAKEQRQAMAAVGGRASHVGGKAHQYTPAEASAAAKKSHAPGSRRKA